MGDMYQVRPADLEDGAAKVRSHSSFVDNQLSDLQRRVARMMERWGGTSSGEQYGERQARWDRAAAGIRDALGTLAASLDSAAVRAREAEMKATSHAAGG
ncbi:MAG TPA: WXG100 family type VII secretion target [Cryptosporangiaceae bacterium]|nr:WXG100 family type VII secretion target [Cryptosporangiaceae bacterium]